MSLLPRMRWSVNILKVVAADSGAAILSDNFEPLHVVASSAVLVLPPYRKAEVCITEPIFAPVSEGHQLVVHELELCHGFLKKVSADVIHLDMSMGSIALEVLSPVQLSNMKISNRARTNVLKILPKLRKIATDIKRTYNIDVLAIGKDSVPVRVAELTAGAYAVLYMAEKVVKENKMFRLGLPAKCSVRIGGNTVVLESLKPAEHDVIGYAQSKENFLEKVEICEMPNPCARGFRVLEISPKCMEKEKNKVGAKK